jgi:hypothetical protein
VVNFGTALVFDSKTDLRVDYNLYRAANNYNNNAAFSEPYGSDATEHTVTAVVSRQVCDNVKVSMKYSYYNYGDGLYGGHNNYDGHLVYCSVMTRF